MRILLIDIVRTTLDVIWPAVEHSLGLLYLAAVLRKEHGDSVDITIRTLVSNPYTADSEQRLVQSWLTELEPDLVGIRSLTLGAKALRMVAETAKAHNPGCVVVAGGPYATDAPEDALSGPIDCVAVGEGEWTFAEMVECLLDNRGYSDVRGLAFLRAGKLVRTPARPMIENLDDLPFPAWDLVDHDLFTNRYLDFTSKIFRRHGNILSTRGCPYHCAYCHNILGKTFRARSPESVFSEIRHLHDTYGLTDFQFIDDIFNLDLDRAKAICDLIIDSGLDLTFSFPNGVRADRMDAELIDKMARAGTRFMSYAVETASPRLQKLIRKNMDLDKAFTAIEQTTQAGIITRGYFMLGFPGETEEEVLATIDYAKRSALCGVTFFAVVYYPGTPLYHLARSMGYFQDEDAVLDREYVQVGEGPYDFSVDRLRELKRQGIAEFAFTEARLEQAFTMLPGYFEPREVDAFLMAYVVSSGLTAEELPAGPVRQRLARHFLSAERFSKKSDFYV
jgi:anaerobic magnesium-protoporphyrin IX monomethyl ester cyclase